MGKNGVLKRTLDNGLKVLVKEMHHAPVATWWVWYRVGSRDEVPGITGASHWVEHMLFKGTPKYPAGVLDKTISRDGGQWNAMTWIDWTTYFETMPAHRIELGIDLEADRMVNSLFDPEEVASERTVIISERSGSENSPAWLLYEELIGASFRVHPYHHSVIGDRADLESMSRDDLYNHYRRYYVPNNATAVLVGDVDAEAMFDLIAEKYGAIPPGEQPPEVGRAEPPGRRGQRAHSSYVPGTQVRVLTPTVFQALIATRRLTSAATSSGWYWAATSAYASAGTWVWASSVTDSVKASAARSRAVKNGVSRQAGSA